MKNSPLQLEHYFISDLHFAVNPMFDTSKVAEMKHELFFVEFTPTQDTSDPLKWQIALRLRHQADSSANAAYSFSLELIGFFAVDKEFPENSKDRLVKTNGPSILYGVAREIIRSLTSSGPHPGVLIPSVSFYESPPPKEQKEVETPKESQQLPTA
jgi:preprotein translocase subunit SecB